MDKQQANSLPIIQTLYPNLNQRLSVQKELFNQTSKVNPYSSLTNPTQSPSTQAPRNETPAFSLQLKQHSIRSLRSWKDLIKQTVDWINKNIHPARVVSISVVLCHSTTAGQCTVFYNNIDGTDEYMRQKIKPIQGCFISAAIVETGKKWDNHHLDVLKTAQQLGKFGIISITQLQAGLTHNKAVSIIWFLQK